MKQNFSGKPVIIGSLYQTSCIKSLVFFKLLFQIVLFTFFISLSYSLKILPKPCSNALGEQGTCMFVWECIKTEGKHLGTCVDGFLFGSCCSHNESLNQLDSESFIQIKPSSSNSYSTAYHTENDISTTNLELSNDNFPSQNFTSFINFNNNPPNDNDAYHVQELSSSSPTSLSPLSSITQPSSSTTKLNIYSYSSNSNNEDNNSNNLSSQPNNSLKPNHNLIFNNQEDNEDHRRPQTHFQTNTSISFVNDHRTQQTSNLKNNFTQIKDKQNSNKKPSFINFNENSVTNQSVKPTSMNNSKYNISQTISTTVLPPILINYNPFKPTNNSVPVILKNYTNLLDKKPIVTINLINNYTKPYSTNHQSSIWNSYFKPWPNKPMTNGQLWLQSFTTKPSTSLIHTFRPPSLSFFKPHYPVTENNLNNLQSQNLSSSNHNFNSNNQLLNKPTIKPFFFKPSGSPINYNSFYSTRTTPVLSNTQSNSQFSVTPSSLSLITTSTEQPFLIKPNFNLNNTVYYLQDNNAGNNQSLKNSTYSKPNEATTVVVTNGNYNNFVESTMKLHSNPSYNEIKSKVSCGSPKVLPHTKVVGGRSAAFGAWPWQVSVRRTSFFGFSSTHRCGGAILSENWIATAAHCVDDLLMSQIRIRVGEYDFASVLEPYPYQERTVRRKVVHPQYNFFTYENDLALVELEESLIFQPHIAPICLPEETVQLLGKNATVTGWGRLSEGGVLPSVLQEVKVPIVSNDKCKNMFLNAGRHEYIPDVFMCAGFEQGGHDSCQGDSGGPLQVRGEDGKWFLAGIISWGIGCAEPNLPGVCTRISKFKNWIQSVIV